MFSKTSVAIFENVLKEFLMHWHLLRTSPPYSHQSHCTCNVIYYTRTRKILSIVYSEIIIVVVVKCIMYNYNSRESPAECLRLSSTG